MNIWATLVVLSLGTFRLTRLVVRDDFPPIKWARSKIFYYRATYRHETEEWEPRWWGELVSCHWCVSAYTSAGLVGITTIFTSVPVPVFTWLAVWGAGAIIADRAS